MRNRELLMREASEYMATRHSPRTDYSDIGYPACIGFLAAGVIVAALFVWAGDVVRAWCYGFLLITTGIGVLVYSRHPMGSYERADIDIWWPTTYRGYGTIYKEHEELFFVILAVYFIGLAIILRLL